MKKFIYLALVFGLFAGKAHAQFPNRQAMDSLNKLTEQDYKFMLNQLHITGIRPGADGNNPQAPNAANYDEAKANPFTTLPDALLLNNGKKVTSANMWFNQRRPQIVEDFDREIYGRIPQNTPKVTWEITATTTEINADIPVITKTLIGHVNNSAYPAIKVDIQLTVSTPAKASGPVPVMIEFGFVFPPGMRVPPAAANGGPDWKQQLLAKGWGYAVLIPTSIQLIMVLV
jgi:hypothetical protein